MGRFQDPESRGREQVPTGQTETKDGERVPEDLISQSMHQRVQYAHS